MKFSAHDMLADSWSNLHRLVIVSNQLPYFGRPLLLLKRRIDVAQLAELIALELAFQVMSRADHSNVAIAFQVMTIVTQLSELSALAPK